MNREDILARLKDAMVAELYLEDVTAADMTEDMVLFGEGLKLDSVDAVELVVIVEKHFNVAVKDAEEAKEAFATLGGLADFIQARMSAS